MPARIPSPIAKPFLRPKCRWLMASLILLNLSSAAAREPDGEFELPSHLRLSDALRLFREHGLDLILAEAAVEGARGDTLLASAAPNPSFSGGVGRSFACSSDNGTQDCSALAWSVGISDGSAVFDSISGKRVLRMNTANLALEVARKGEADARRTLEGPTAPVLLADGCRAPGSVHAKGSAGDPWSCGRPEPSALPARRHFRGRRAQGRDGEAHG